MIIDYSNASRLAVLFTIVDPDTGEDLSKPPFYYADDRIGLIRRYVNKYPDRAGQPQYFTGPDGNIASEDVRRPIRVVVAPRVIDPDKRSFAEAILERYRDYCPAAWTPDRINDAELLLIGVTEDAMGIGRVGGEAIDEVRAFVDEFRRMQSELHPMRDERPPPRSR